MTRRAAAGALLLLLLLPVQASALDAPPQPLGRVSDFAAALPSDRRAAIEARLAEMASSTTKQIAVAIFPTLDGEALEDLTMRIAERWKIGGKANSDGVVLFVFLRERKLRIEVGYGLESLLPDARAARILRDTIAPELRAGRLADGIAAGIEAIYAAVEPDAAAPAPAATRRPRPYVPPPPPTEADPRGVLIGVGVGLLIVLFVLWMIVRFVRWADGLSTGGSSGGDATSAVAWSASRDAWSESSSSSDTSSSSDFSGGGGSFGGGGASGDW